MREERLEGRIQQAPCNNCAHIYKSRRGEVTIQFSSVQLLGRHRNGPCPPEGVPMKRFPERSAAACCRPQSEVRRDHLCPRALSSLPTCHLLHPRPSEGSTRRGRRGMTCCSPSRALYPSSGFLAGADNTAEPVKAPIKV